MSYEEVLFLWPTPFHQLHEMKIVLKQGSFGAIEHKFHNLSSILQFKWPERKLDFCNSSWLFFFFLGLRKSHAWRQILAVSKGEYPGVKVASPALATTVFTEKRPDIIYLTILEWCWGFSPLLMAGCVHTKSEAIFFARPNPMKSQRTEAAIDAIFFRAARFERHDVGDAFTAALFPPLVEIFKFWGGNLATRANQLLSCFTRHCCPAVVESEQDGQ